jgi:hypothetical protein
MQSFRSSKTLGLASITILFLSSTALVLAQDNIATTGVAAQSSDFAPAFGADKGNDGIRGNFTATASADDNATWEVDLGAPAEISSIVVYNRGDGCCQSRLRDITVSIRDFSIAEDPFGDEDALYESELLNEENVDGGGTLAGPAELIVDLAAPITGRYVRVHRLGDPDLSGTGGQGNADEANVLSVGEVEVFGVLKPTCPAEGTADHGDTSCGGLSIEPPVGGGAGLHLLTADASDATGDEILYTFVAVDAIGSRIEIGPGPSNFAEIDLRVGSWTVSVTVDDSKICDDVGASATCTEQVDVDAPDDPNKALFRPSRQSSDYVASLGAGLANDGVLTNFTATGPADENPTWEVDLIDEIDITSILIHNRGDGCCQSRLRDISVTILDNWGEDGEILFESELLNEENVLGGGGTGGPPVLSIDLVALTGGPVKGRIVRVVRTPDPDLSGTGGQGNADEANVMSIGEVEVFDTLCLESEAVCDSVIVEGPEDEGPGLYTLTAIASGGLLRYYTFTASNGVDPEFSIGPQESEIASFQLLPGTWTFTVVVSDSIRCVNESPDGQCQATATVRSLGFGDNIALGKPATQSTDFIPTLGAVNAVDGNYGNLTATASADDAATWEVDLEGTFPINTIVLYNRGDGCCQSRLRDITVTILDAEGGIVWESELLNEENELGGMTTDGPPRLLIELRELEGRDLSGARVRVARLPDPDLSGTGGGGNVDEANVLSLGEVEVWSQSVVNGKNFVRGDADASGTINITDGIFILGFLFLGGTTPGCQDASDTDDSEALNITDGIYILSFLFLGGSPPPAPHPACGPDPAGDTVDCVTPPANCAG